MAMLGKLKRCEEVVFVVMDKLTGLLSPELYAMFFSNRLRLPEHSVNRHAGQTAPNTANIATCLAARFKAPFNQSEGKP
jgi:hypothetical protein